MGWGECSTGARLSRRSTGLDSPFLLIPSRPPSAGALMPIHKDDQRSVLYEIAADLIRSSIADDSAGWARPRRGMVQFQELVLHGLDSRCMTLDHLAVVANAALMQVKGEWGSQSEEYKGGLLALASLLGYVKGGHAALRHPILEPYHSGPF